MAQQGGSPEQQMVQMEAQRLGLEKEKVQAQLAKEATEGALKNRDLDLKEQKIALDAYKIGAEGLLKAEEREKDRNTEQAMNAVKMLVDMIKQGDSIQSAESIKTSDVLIKMLEDAKKERE
jgi:predicted RNA-binding protein Jag